MCGCSSSSFVSPLTPRCHSRCVALSRFTPELSLEAVRVLYWVCHSPKASRDLVATILGDKVNGSHVRYKRHFVCQKLTLAIPIRAYMHTHTHTHMRTYPNFMKDVSMEILQGFVEHLEWEEFDSVPVTGLFCLRQLSHPLSTLPSPSPPHPPPEVQEEGFSSVGQVHCAVQLDILKLLASSINMPMVHFLLGFDVRSRKQTKETTLQDPGKEWGGGCL